MLRGLPASIIAHAAVFSASYLTLPYWGSASRVYATDIEAVDVNFAELGEITNIAPLIAQEPEELEPETAPEELEEEVPEDPVEEELPEAEVEATTPDPVAAEEDPEDLLPDFEQDKPEEEPEREPEREPDPAPKPPRDSLTDFLNQSESTFRSEIETRKKEPEPQPRPPQEQPKTALKDAPRPVETRNRRGSGERNANTARLQALLVSRIKNECWSGVDDLPNPERYNVQMNLKLHENGTIEELTLIDPKRRPIGNSHMRTAVDRALRAVRKCEPYRLPSEEYEEWQEIDFYLGLEFAQR